MIKWLKIEREEKKSKFKRIFKMEEQKTENEINQSNQQKENNREWLENRKPKSKNPNKIKDKRDRRKTLVEREATNQVEDLLVRTAFSAIL